MAQKALVPPQATVMGQDERVIGCGVVEAVDLRSQPGRVEANTGLQRGRQLKEAFWPAKAFLVLPRP
jgi:hypothetical protein